MPRQLGVEFGGGHGLLQECPVRLRLHHVGPRGLTAGKEEHGAGLERLRLQKPLARRRGEVPGEERTEVAPCDRAPQVTLRDAEARRRGRLAGARPVAGRSQSPGGVDLLGRGRDTQVLAVAVQGDEPRSVAALRDLARLREGSRDVGLRAQRRLRPVDLEGGDLGLLARRRHGGSRREREPDAVFQSQDLGSGLGERVRSAEQQAQGASEPRLLQHVPPSLDLRRRAESQPRSAREINSSPDPAVRHDHDDRPALARSHQLVHDAAAPSPILLILGQCPEPPSGRCTASENTGVNSSAPGTRLASLPNML